MSRGKNLPAVLPKALISCLWDPDENLMLHVNGRDVGIEQIIVY